MKSLSKLSTEFSFAGFAFPKYVWTLDHSTFAKRIQHMRNPVIGPYYHAPKPNQADGVGFYLNSDGGPKLRWTWADEVEGISIDHTGWWTDENGDFDTIRGVVFRLPHSKGFLAGWSMGEGMASEIDSHVYSEESEAAYAADRMAEQAAEREREYQESFNDEN